MKIKYLLPGLILSAGILTSCGEEKTEAPKTETKEPVKEEIADENSAMDESVQKQWDDIVSIVKSGEKGQLDMYLLKTGANFHQEEWDFLDFSSPEYAEAFGAYASYKDIPSVDGTTEDKVITVHFSTDQDGEVFESSVIINFTLQDGFVWINGCMIAG